MAQGGYQQLAKEVMSNGGSMKQAGAIWQAAGKNLQKAQQMLRKGGNNRRNMRGGEGLPDDPGANADAGLGSDDGTGAGPKGSDSDAVSMDNQGGADGSLLTDDASADKAPPAEEQTEEKFGSMFGGKRRRNSRRNRRRNHRGGSDAPGANNADEDPVDIDEEKGDLSEKMSDMPDTQNMQSMMKNIGAMTGMFGGKRRSQKKRNNRKGGNRQSQKKRNNRKGGKKQSRKGGKKQSRKGGKNNRRN